VPRDKRRPESLLQCIMLDFARLGAGCAASRLSLHINSRGNYLDSAYHQLIEL
jgi:hypothetical protein